MLGVTGCKEKKEYESSYHEPRNMSEIVELVSEENLSDIITTEYSNKELNDLRLTKDLTLEELDSKYRIECIKIDISEPNSYYKVVYKSKKKYLFIYFDEEGNNLYSYTTGISKEKRYFDSVEIGKTKKISIYLLDFGNGEWAPIHSTLETSRYSRHHTKDGYVITYEYDEDGYVKNKKVEMI